MYNISIICFTVTLVSFLLKLILYHRAPFWGLQISLKRKFRKRFSWIYISLQSAICVTIGFLIIFGETNFMEVQKIRKICNPQERCPTVFITIQVKWHMHFLLYLFLDKFVILAVNMRTMPNIAKMHVKGMYMISWTLFYHVQLLL